MKNLKRFSMIGLLGLFSLLSIAANAATITVPDDQPTIQAGINAATNGDEVIVKPGIYYENISINGKDITLSSTDPTSSTVVAASNPTPEIVMSTGAASPWNVGEIPESQRSMVSSARA